VRLRAKSDEWRKEAIARKKVNFCCSSLSEVPGREEIDQTRTEEDVKSIVERRMLIRRACLIRVSVYESTKGLPRILIGYHEDKPQLQESF
jgi:hypothetical protein